jgi:hypothetical protein
LSPDRQASAQAGRAGAVVLCRIRLLEDQDGAGRAGAWPAGGAQWAPSSAGPRAHFGKVMLNQLS